MKRRTTVLQLVLAVLLVSAGCSEPAASVEPIGYPASVRDAFVKGCAAESTLATCECMLNKLEGSMPLTDFLDLESAGTDAVLKDDRVIAAVLACVN